MDGVYFATTCDCDCDRITVTTPSARVPDLIKFKRSFPKDINWDKLSANVFTSFLTLRRRRLQLRSCLISGGFARGMPFSDPMIVATPFEARTSLNTIRSSCREKVFAKLTQDRVGCLKLSRQLCLARTAAPCQSRFRRLHHALRI